MQPDRQQPTVQITLRAAFAGLAAGGALLLGAPSAAAQDQPASAATVAEVRLGPGDVVELTAAGIPELTYRAMIDPTGQLALPLQGAIPAAGLTIDELRDAVRDVIADRVIQRRDGGALVPVTVTGDLVAVQVIEYRPIYVMGDVTTPGQQAFRPGMTARQAIGNAGGYDLLPLGQRPSVLEAVELLERIESGELALERERARNGLLRAQAGLDGEDGAREAPGELTFGSIGAPAEEEGSMEPDAPVVPAGDFVAIEQERARSRAAEDQAAIEHLQELVNLNVRQHQLLLEQQAVAEQAVATDQEDLDRITQLSEQGLVAESAGSEARQALNASTVRLQGVILALGDLERDRLDLTQQLATYDEQRREEALEALGDSELELRQLEVQVENAAQRLGLVGALPGDQLHVAGEDVDIRIARAGADQEEQIEAAFDTLLQPGDVIEVDVPMPRR